MSDTAQESKYYRGKQANPEFRSDRSAKGAAVRTERTRTIKEIASLTIGKRVDDLATEELNAWAERLAAAAPPLTTEQLDNLRPKLAGGAR